MAKNTIFIKKYVDNYTEEVVATAKTVTPGMLIERTSADAVQPHSTVGGAAQKMFAGEDALQGYGIDDDYAAAARIPKCGICVPGEHVYALLANGENVAIGAKLISNGNGYLRARDSASSGEEPLSIVAIALEARDLSSSSGADAGYRIEVETC
jgi:hypothetical protein